MDRPRCGVFPLLLPVILMAGCQSFCDPDDAPDGGDTPNPDANWEVFRNADNAFFYIDSDPGDPMEEEWRFVNRDMTLSIDQPDEPIGYAFELTYGDDSWEDNILFWRFVLQYDLPPRPCFTNVDWYVRPRFRLPNGHFVTPSPGDAFVDVEMYAVGDATPTEVLESGTGIVRDQIEAYHQTAMDSNTNYVRRVFDDNTMDSVLVAPTFTGTIGRPADEPGRIYVVASLSARRPNNGVVCLGCESENELTSLLDVAAFLGMARSPRAEELGHFGPEYVISPCP